MLKTKNFSEISKTYNKNCYAAQNSQLSEAKGFVDGAHYRLQAGPSRRGGRGGKRSRARALKGPVNILCDEILLLLYISSVHFYDNLSALKGYLQEPSTLMTVFMLETKPSYYVLSDLSKLVLSR